MSLPEIFADEPNRIATLRQYEILDTLPEQALDDLTAVAAQICGTPISLVSLVDTERQWFKARFGSETVETSRDVSFCAHALHQREIFVVPDATQDERFAQNALVTGNPNIRFYAGAPLITPENATLGTLCVIDRVPRILTPMQAQTLEVLARQVMTHLELNRQVRALRLSEERFSNAFEYAPIGMALVSVEGQWLKVNQALCDLLGYSAQELQQKTFQEMTHPDDLGSDLDFVHQLLAGQLNSYHIEKRYYHKKGHFVWAKLGVSLVSDARSKQVYFISQIQDITDLKLALERQQELTEQARSAEKAKSEFLAIMSHEIRTPLNGVIGMTDILAETDLNEMQRECVNTIQTSGDSLLTVINDILDYSKIEAGRLELECRSFNLRQCVEEAFDLFAEPIRAKQLEVNSLFAPDVPAQVVGDSQRLRQILLNLISNAIKFTGQGEIVIEVQCSETDEKSCHLIFSVTDTGIGISREGMDRLFHAFQQADVSTSRRFGGTGLGLIICKRLAGFMGGTMWVESKPGVGSTFFFTAVMPVCPQGETNELSTRIKLLKPQSVLIVDDNATNRKMLTTQLQTWGMTPTTVSSADEAWQQVARQTFGVALIDLQMPGTDGIALARRIKAETDLPLVLLSPTGEILGEKDAGLFGAQIQKPVRQVALLNALLKVAGVVEKQAQKPANGSFDASQGVKYPLRILLAEDNAVNQKVGLSVLGRMGYTADISGDGKQALAAMEKASYDVVFMDIQMPVMDGIEATRLLREKLGKKCPSIIALTAEALEGDEERFLKLGFDNYLSKPLQVRKLQTILKGIRPLSAD